MDQQRRRRPEARPAGRVVAAVIALVLVAPAAIAQTLAWDASPDSSVVGYRARYGDSPASLHGTVDVANTLALSLVSWSRERAWFFCVEAYTAQQLTSPCSEVVVLPADPHHRPNPTPPSMPAPPDPTHPPATPRSPVETYDQWATRHGAGAARADPDADGAVNTNEFANGTDPLVPNRWLFAEGATGAFREDIALANPGAETSRVRVRVLRAGQPAIEAITLLEGASRSTIRVNDLPGAGAISAGIEVVAETGGVVAERTMTWRSPEGTRPAHAAKGIANPSRQWFFAEGEARLTDTWFLLANPGAASSAVTFAFVTDSGRRATRTYIVDAKQRLSVWTNQIPELQGTSFATTVTATRPIVAERALYFWRGRTGWRGGHASAGAPALARRWFVAEGRTGPFFDTYLLLGNPGTRSARVTLRYLTPNGLGRTDVRTIPAHARLTVAVDQLRGLENTDVSVDVESSAPIVVERSMYWPGDARRWRDGHNSIAIAALGTRWVLAEGRWHDEDVSESYVLLANPNAVATTVTLRVLREAGWPSVFATRVIAANTRETVRIDDTLGLRAGEEFSVEVTADQPIAVERSIYTSVGGTWTSGTNETGIRLR